MKKLLNTVYVTAEGPALKKDGENLMVEIAGGEKARAPPHMLASVAAFGPIQLSPAVMGTCARRGITLVLLDRAVGFLHRAPRPARQIDARPTHALELRQIRKSFGATQRIPGADLSVEPGEFCVFFRPVGLWRRRSFTHHRGA